MTRHTRQEPTTKTAAMRNGAGTAEASVPASNDLQDMARRIFGQHWLVLLVIVIVFALISGFAHGQSTSYTASARVVLDTPDPTTRAEAQAISDTVQAIATSPAQVQAALKDANVTGHDPLDVADHHVSVTGLGSSAVVSLSVSDSDPRTAASIANALARRVIAAREQFTTGNRDRALTQVDGKLADLTTQIADSGTRLDALNAQLAQASGSQADLIRARRDDAARASEALTQQRSALESERISILTAFAERPQPSVVTAATVPQHADSSATPQYLVLGALLGLILGVGVAAAMELFRPSVVGGEALARELGVPLLGAVRSQFSGEIDETGLAHAAGRVRLAAHASSVLAVELLEAPGEVGDRTLGALAALVANGGLDVAIVKGDSLDRWDDSSAGAPARLQKHTGVVLVTPYAVKKSTLLDTARLLQFRHGTVLGVMVCGSPRSLPLQLGTRTAAAFSRRAAQPE